MDAIKPKPGNGGIVPPWLQYPPIGIYPMPKVPKEKGVTTGSVIVLYSCCFVFGYLIGKALFS